MTVTEAQLKRWIAYALAVLLITIVVAVVAVSIVAVVTSQTPTIQFELL